MEIADHEYYVSPEVAKLLKEAGFDWEVCEGYVIYGDGNRFTTGFQIAYNFNGDNGDLFIDYRGHTEVFSKPTLDIAQRWLREVKGYSIYPTYGGYKIYVLDANDSAGFSRTYGLNSNLTYEEAQESGIKKALEIILGKGE